MITNAAVHQITSSRHPCEDRYRLLGTKHPRVRGAGRGHLYAVIDGVGGAPKGMQAAQLVQDRLVEFYDRPAATDQELADLMRSINDEAYAFGIIEATKRPLAAAAVTVAWFAPTKQVFLFHVGDTLALRFDGERLSPLTHEHGQGKVIRRYLGQGPGFFVDRPWVALEEGEMIVLVTDGVTKGLNNGDLEAVLREVPDPARAAQEIAERARRRGSQDDITCLLVELEEW